MRLAEFILANVEPILAEWESFARSIWPGAAQTDPAELRDHAAELLRATVDDMRSAQSSAQQSDKSRGRGGAGGADSEHLNDVSELHAAGRAVSGFDLPAVVSEYRALRASVCRLWRESIPQPDVNDLADLTRFNESIDQSLTKAIRGYSHRIDRSRQMFLAILGHDLRNPLNAIALSAEALAAGGRLDESDREMAAHVADGAVEMGRMIADLLDFTAATLGVRMPVRPAAIDLKDLCGEVIREMRVAHPDCTIGFRAAGEFAGEWDRARLRQVVSNLLANACQYGGDAWGVEVMLAGHGPDEVVLTVHNDGAAIPRDVLPTIFDPLVRGGPPDPAKRHRRGSLGLGLYIAREVVTAHGGTIDVSSSDPAGTTFTVRLPRRPPRA
jgi:signal transduction histidine kinase